MRLKVIVPPASEPVSLQEMCAYLRLDCDEEQSLIGQLIKAARQYCEDFQHRAYLRQTLELVDRPMNNILELPRSENLQEVLSVSNATLNNVGYTVVQDLLARLCFTAEKTASYKLVLPQPQSNKMSQHPNTTTSTFWLPAHTPSTDK